MSQSFTQRTESAALHNVTDIEDDSSPEYQNPLPAQDYARNEIRRQHQHGPSLEIKLKIPQCMIGKENIQLNITWKQGSHGPRQYVREYTYNADLASQWVDSTQG